MKTKNQLMLVSYPRLTQIAISLLGGMGLTLCLLSQQSIAQVVNSAQPADNFKTQDNQDPLSGSRSADSFSVFNMIHRAQMGNIRDMGEFSSDQVRKLDDAAAKFRLLQLQQIRQKNPATSVPSGTNPQSAK